jgi:2-methylcitrate dehydratase PrpD
MIAVSTLPTCQPVVNLVRKMNATGECSIVGHPLRTSLLSAALANGTIGHGAEVDSTGQLGTGHFASVVVPTVLSVGQYVRATGKQFIRALAVGAEVTGRFVSVLGHYDLRGQFASTVAHPMGIVVSAGLLLGLNEEQMEDAMGLAASGACGLNSHHEEEFHQTKSLDKGRAVEAGVLSALLVLEGYHGPHEVLTMANGYFDAFLGLPSAGHDIVKGLGEEYTMRQIAYKRYPVGGPAQTPLYALLQLIKTHGLVADDIEQIEVTLASNAYHTVMTNKNPSIYMPTVLSLAAVYGEITFAHINDPRYRADPRVKAFQERTRIFIIPRSGPATRAQRMETALTVRTRDGKVLRQELRYPVLTEDEIQQKFRTLAGLRLDSKRVTELERKLKAIETEQNVTSVIRALEIPY